MFLEFQFSVSFFEDVTTDCRNLHILENFSSGFWFRFFQIPKYDQVKQKVISCSLKCPPSSTSTEKQTAPLLQKSSKGEGVEKGVIGKLVGASYQNPTPLEKIEIVKTVTS